MLNGTSGVSTGVALIAVAGVCVSLLGTVPASSDPEGSLNKEKALVTACMKAIRVFAPNPGDDPFVHSVTNQYSNPDGTENPASTRSSRGKATELELSVLPDYNQVHDRELQEDGRFVGFIRNKSFDKDNPLDVASKTYNVFGGDTTCVFIGRARDESPITGSASPKNVVRGLRSLLVHQGVSQARYSLNT